MEILTYALTALLAAAAVVASLRFLHMLQLESYQGFMYLKWLRKHFSDDAFPILLIGIMGFTFRAASLLFSSERIAEIAFYASDVLCIIMLTGLCVKWFITPHRKPLKYTARMIRLICAVSILVVLFSTAFFTDGIFPASAGDPGVFVAASAIRFIPITLMPFVVLLAYMITYPIEWAVKKWYFNDARKKLAARSDIIKIGITGSYGKTSSKFMLSKMLAEKYNVLYTPSSFNTPMGITKIIRGELKPEHEVFVAEMGARYVGDIKELCNLVKPTVGIITAVGKQHLETFGSLQAIIDTKAELLQALPKDGKAFVNGDSELCVGMLEKCGADYQKLFGIEGKNLFMHAENISVGEWGSSFELVTDSGERVSCTTELLGRHNILNITGAAAAAYSLEVPLQSIAHAVSELKPIEHRLQLIKGAVTVIDDAFNSNPAGACAALEVISAFPGRRIIVTPGMVELGEEEDMLNEQFGQQMASCVDIAILVGKSHVDPIEHGLLSNGFDKSCVVRVATLDEATEKLPLFTENGCVVLFENDLSDNYNE